jgi:ribulose-5-phosphate 4-epimerase/fuculose-1-phosphate aldolase
VKNAIALEAVAEMAINTLAIASAGEVRTIQPELLEKHQGRKHGPNAYYGQPSEP